VAGRMNRESENLPPECSLTSSRVKKGEVPAPDGRESRDSPQIFLYSGEDLRIFYELRSKKRIARTF
jgi:hypothetical protein